MFLRNFHILGKKKRRVSHQAAMMKTDGQRTERDLNTVTWRLRGTNWCIWVVIPLGTLTLPQIAAPSVLQSSYMFIFVNQNPHTVWYLLSCVTSPRWREGHVACVTACWIVFLDPHSSLLYNLLLYILSMKSANPWGFFHPFSPVFFKYVKFSLLQIKALRTDDFVSCTPRWGNVIVCYATSTKLIWFDLTCTHSPGAQITTHAEGVCDVFVCSGRHYSPLSLRGEQLFAATLIF